MSIRSELRRLLMQGGRQAPKTYRPVPEEPPPDEAWWESILHFLGRPAYASAGFTKAMLTGGDPLGAAWRGLSGRDRTTYSDVLKAGGMGPGAARWTLGFLGDVFLDPTTYLTFGSGAGAKATIGGIAKTLTPLAAGAREALAAQKIAKIAEVLPKLKPVAREKLLKTTGLSVVGELMEPGLLAKEAGKRVATRSLGKAVKGEAVPAGMEKLLGKGIKPEALVKKPYLRFAGIPLVSGETLAKPFRAGGKAYLAAENIPFAGKVLQVVRQAGMTFKEAAKKVFSASTGMPEYDAMKKKYANILDNRTMSMIHSYEKTAIKPLSELRKLGMDAYNDAIKQIDTFMEGVVKMEDVADEVKLTKITGRMESLRNQLDEAVAALGAPKKSATLTILEEGIKRGKAAQAIAKHETKIARDVYAAEIKPILKEMREIGISKGDLGSEFVENVPQHLRRKKGRLVDQWVDYLERRGQLPAGAGYDDFFKWLKAATQKPKKLQAEDILASMTVRSEPGKAAQPASSIERILERRVKGLETALEVERAKLAATPSLKAPRVVQGPTPSHPAAASIAVFLKGRFEAIHKAEKAGLALPPHKMEFYLPHYMKGEVRDALIDIINSDARKVLRPEFTQRLSEAMRRTAHGRVDEITLGQLVESGAIDPSKARDYLAARGVRLTGDDLLVFETNPVVAALKRELHSIRALTAAEMAKEIMESPVFMKAKVVLGDVDRIKMTLWQHPGHALFVPTRSFIEKFRSASEREAMRMGKEKAIVGSFLQEIHKVELDDIAKSPAKRTVEAYILPREVAEHLSRAYSLQFDEKAISDAFRLWDKGTSWWKAFATIIRPGFHIRNEASNIWQLLLAGMRSPEPLLKAGLILSNPAHVAGVGRYTAEEILKLADLHGVRRTGFIGSDIGELIKRAVDPSRNPFSVTGPVARFGTKVGTTIEDHARLALFIDQLGKGSDPAAAAMHVAKYMFDYRDLSKIERGLFRRFLPFYSWSRKNIPLSIETMLTKPGFVMAMEKAREGAEKNVEDALARRYVSEFIREGLGIPFRKTPDGKTEFFLLKGWIPTADLMKMDIQEIGGMLHPVPKAAIEYLANKSLYTGRAIERFPGEKQKFIGASMPAQAAQVLRNLVFMQELDRLFFKEEFDATRVGLGVAGIRTYKQDKIVQMRGQVYRLQDEMGMLKNALTLATQRYGGKSDIARQYEERLERIILERDYVKDALLKIDPEALSTRKAQESVKKPRPMPTTLQGMRRMLDIDRMLRSTGTAGANR